MKLRSLRFPLCLLVVLVLGTLAAGTGPAYAVWQLAWSDEFNDTTVDTSKWTFDTGNGFWVADPGYWVSGWGNNELEYYTSRSQNVYEANGLLHLVAQKETYSGFNYTSGRIKTMGLFTKQYGRFEFRAKLPAGVGCWPALWMLPQNPTYGGWPNNGEIDVVENNGSTPTKEGGTIHFGGANGNDVYFGKTYTFPAGDGVTNFHLYALEWTTNSITWSVDGTVYEVQTNWWSNIGTATNTYPYPAPFNQPFYILMNLAIGGNYVGNPTTNQINAGTAFPVEMQLDYVRVYDNVPATNAPDAPTGLTASPGNGKVFLQWTASTSGATGYQVKRSVAGSAYQTVASLTNNSYTDLTAGNCSSYSYVVSATNSFGESTNSSEALATLGGYAVAVNSGGSAVGQFGADASFSGGAQASPVTTPIDTSAVTAPAPQAVYQSERYGNFTYTFTGLTPGLSYKVRLHFAETYWTSVGQRKFNVSINGTQMLANFDIIAAAGAPNKATVREFMVTPSSGQIAIQYVTVTDNAKSSGLEVLLPAPAVPVPGNNGPLYPGMTLSLTASTVPGATYAWTGPNGFSSSLQNPSITNIAASDSGPYSVAATVGGCASFPATTWVTVNPLPLLGIQLSGTHLTLTWTNGTLQAATNFAGPWADVPGASTPYAPLADQSQQFYRLRLP